MWILSQWVSYPVMNRKGDGCLEASLGIDYTMQLTVYRSSHTHPTQHSTPLRFAPVRRQKLS